MEILMTCKHHPCQVRIDLRLSFCYTSRIQIYAIGFR